MKVTLEKDRVCTVTVMDRSDPAIVFDEDGVSNHARRFRVLYERPHAEAQEGQRAKELSDLVTKIKETGYRGRYDCVIGVSGGVDSTYLAVKAVELGLRPLLVHFDSGWNSPIAEQNIRRLAETLDLELLVIAPARKQMADLQLAFLRSGVPNCDMPTDHAFGVVLLRVARRYGIKYILSGSNVATESVLPESWGHRSTDRRHLRAIHAEWGNGSLSRYPSMSDFQRYFLYPLVYGIKTVKPLDLMPYVDKRARKEIREKVGWKSYGGKHYESVFTRFFQGYYLPKKFGIDKRRAHLSSLILSGQMDRETALRELAVEPLTSAQLAEDVDRIADVLGIRAADLFYLTTERPRAHSEYRSNERLWRLLTKVRTLVARQSTEPSRARST